MIHVQAPRGAPAAPATSTQVVAADTYHTDTGRHTAPDIGPTQLIAAATDQAD